MGAHLVDGKFQSDKYPTTPAGKVPLSVRDKRAQDLLWEYAQRHRAIDAEFSDDLEAALRTEGYIPPDVTDATTAMREIVAGIGGSPPDADTNGVADDMLAELRRRNFAVIPLASRDSFRTLGISGEAYRQALIRAADFERQVETARDNLKRLIEIARERADAWDVAEPRDMHIGKFLIALAGRARGYIGAIDALHEFVAATAGVAASPVLQRDLRVGITLFHAGVAFSSVQAAIDRLADRATTAEAEANALRADHATAA